MSRDQLLRESDPMAIVNATFRALKRRRVLAYLPLDEKDQVFADVGAACGAIGWYEFLDALNVVARLLDDSYKIADDARDLREPDDVGIAKLKALYPGLSQDVLSDALSHGWFASR